MCIIYKVLMHALRIYFIHLPPEPHANIDTLTGVSSEKAREAVPPQIIASIF